MLIRVQKHENNFVILQKTTLEIKELSWASKGLWAYLLSRPDNWNVSVKHLTKHFPGGRDFIRGCLNELVEHNLCRRMEIKEGGRFKSVEYIMFETPHDAEIFKERLPKPENPAPVLPAPVNPHLTRKYSKKGKIDKEHTHPAGPNALFPDEKEQKERSSASASTPRVRSSDSVGRSDSLDASKKNKPPAKEPPDPKPQKKPRGSQGVVMLTDAQHEKLAADYGADALAELIEVLQDWLLSTGTTRKDHAATLRTFHRNQLKRANDKNASRSTTGTYGYRASTSPLDDLF
jgi:hypothetical protein